MLCLEEKEEEHMSADQVLDMQKLIQRVESLEEENRNLKKELAMYRAKEEQKK